MVCGRKLFAGSSSPYSRENSCDCIVNLLYCYKFLHVVLKFHNVVKFLWFMEFKVSSPLLQVAVKKIL